MSELIPAGLALPAGPERDPLAPLLAAWLAAQRSENTVIAYRRDLTGIGAKQLPARMAVPAWIPWLRAGGIDPLQARRVHVDVYIRQLDTAGASPATINRRVAAISSWYSYLLDEDAADRNPAARATRPYVDRDSSSTIGLSQDETDRLLDEAERDGDRTAAIIAPLYYHGFRVGSLIAADAGDLGWDEGRPVLDIRLKGGKLRRVPLVAEALDPLARYLDGRQSVAPTEPLIATSTRSRIDQPAVYRLIRRVARRAGIESADKLSPHSLRHSVITHLLDEGVPLERVQDFVAHADSRTTLRYDRARRRRIEGLAEILAKRRRVPEAEEQTS